MPDQHGSPKTRRRRPALRRAAAIAVTGALVAGCASGGDDGGDDGGLRDGGARPAAAPELAADLADVAFPPLASLAHGDADGFCAAVSAALEIRGYAPAERSGAGGDAVCTLTTPRLSLVEPGAHELTLTVRGTRGEAGPARYRELLAEAFRVAGEEPPDVLEPLRRDGPEEFPVGEEGFAAHAANTERTEIRAAFRAGEETYELTLDGRLTPDGAAAGRALPRADAHRELIAVVRALGGDDGGGARLIADVDFVRYPGDLPALGHPLPPGTAAGESAREHCPALGELLRPLGLTDEARTEHGCRLVSVAGGEGAAAGEERHQLLVEVHRGDAAAERERSLVRLLSRGYSQDGLAVGPRYRLPAGEEGFMLFREPAGSSRADSRLDAGYLVDGGYFVRVSLSAARLVPDGDRLLRSGLDETGHVDLLAAVLSRLEQAP